MRPLRVEDEVIDSSGERWVVTALNGSPWVCVWNPKSGHDKRHVRDCCHPEDYRGQLTLRVLDDVERETLTNAGAMG